MRSAATLKSVPVPARFTVPFSYRTRMSTSFLLSNVHDRNFDRKLWPNNGSLFAAPIEAVTFSTTYVPTFSRPSIYRSLGTFEPSAKVYMFFPRKSVFEIVPVLTSAETRAAVESLL